MTGGPYGCSLYQERLRRRGVVIKHFLIICLKVGLIGGLLHLLRNIWLLVTETEKKQNNGDAKNEDTEDGDNASELTNSCPTRNDRRRTHREEKGVSDDNEHDSTPSL